MGEEQLLQEATAGEGTLLPAAAADMAAMAKGPLTSEPHFPSLSVYGALPACIPCCA